MAAVGKKTKKESVKKAPVKKQASKFISQALVNRKKKAKSKKRIRPKTRGMVYVKNLPHGFFEDQLRGFFTQFGSITRLRLGRSKKTLRSRGYAFIEFRYPEVAEIATEAINNYIMFKRIIKAKYIPPTSIHHDYFKSSVYKIRKENGEKEWTSSHLMASKLNVDLSNKLLTDDDQKKRIKKIAQKLNKKKRVFADLGIDYDLDNIASDLGVTLNPVVQPKTIANLNDTELDDEADETFDPEKLVLDSEDEIENVDTSDEGSDEEIEVIKKKKAIEVAKNASKQKKAVKKEEKPTKVVEKSIKKIEKPAKVVEKSIKKIEKPAKGVEKIKKRVDKPAKPLKKNTVKKAIEKPAKAVVEKVTKLKQKVEKAPVESVRKSKRMKKA